MMAPRSQELVASDVTQEARAYIGGVVLLGLVRTYLYSSQGTITITICIYFRTRPAACNLIFIIHFYLLLAIG